MVDLRTFAQTVRHSPFLSRLDLLWSCIRGPYHVLLNAIGGARVLIGGEIVVRMPAQYSGFFWEQYEPESMRTAIDWVRSNPGCTVLDIGCSVGIFSVACLFADMQSEVIAFDSDLESLVETRSMCRYCSGSRLRTIYGLVSDESGPALPEALAISEMAIAGRGQHGLPGETSYVCLSDDPGYLIPRIRLDDLFSNEFVGRRILLKCDVEGAELLVLKGARAFLASHRPTLLLSVHPPTLPKYGHTAEQIKLFLHDMQYEVRVIAIDHEEHWFCKPG